jgi:microcystin-dependent protein
MYLIISLLLFPVLIFAQDTLDYTAAQVNEGLRRSLIGFPVGYIYISADNTNPANVLGYGTWEQFGKGKTLVGQDSSQAEFDVIEETGGAKTHTLTTAEMPTHTHIQDAHSHNITDPGHTHSVPTFTTDGSGTRPDNGSSTNGTTITIPSNTTGISINNATATNQNAGSGGAHNNLQPYIVIYFWKRIL